MNNKIIYLTENLSEFKSLSESFQQLFEKFRQTIGLSEDSFIFNEIKVLIKLNKSQCFVSLDKFNENLLNQIQTNVTKTDKNVEIGEIICELSAEDISDNESEGFECNNNYSIESNDETIDESIDRNVEQNSDKIKETNEISDQQIVKNVIQKPIESDLNELHTKITNNLETNINFLVFDKQLNGSPNVELLTTKPNESKTKIDLSSDETEEEIADQKRFRCREEGCPKIFKLRDSLKRHRAVHEGRYVCDYDCCGYRTISEHSLMRHKNSHSNDRPFDCQFCDQKFKDKYCLDGHQKVFHPNELPDLPYIYCDQKECNFRTKYSKILLKHKRSHTLPFVCQTCGKGFSQKQCLNIHMPTHSPNRKKVYKKRFSCDLCKKTFNSNVYLNNHLNTHLGKTPFKCDWPECDKSYAMKASLVVHQFRHKRLDYSCVYAKCDYQTTNPIRFMAHKKTHENQ